MLGVEVEPLVVGDLTDGVADCIARGERAVVAHHNLHSIYLHGRDTLMRDFYQRVRHVPIDGMPLVWLGRLLGYPITREHRVTYIDWMPHLMARAAEEKWQVYCLGSKPGVAEQGAAVLREQFPGLRIRTRHGYFNASTGSADTLAVLAELKAAQPDLVLVGMGMPRQERWIHENFERLPNAVYLTSGAAIDYVAGAVPTPPRWAGRLGLEWFFRLLAEPRRLSGRYLIEPFALAPALARDLATRARRGVSKREPAGAAR